ncbi:MAG: dynamin family protein [Pseudomonadota bacterium]
MNAEPSFTNAPAPHATLLTNGFRGLSDFTERLSALRECLLGLQSLGHADTARSARKLIEQLDALEPSVTMIGQVKAGKTSLVNAMVGWPGLLPADVNPWTSVVTSLHVKADTASSEMQASFKFFGEDEWAKLVDSGGRIGELASRAGADQELEKIQEQVARMREKSQSRLGRKFELLLGQEHDYGYFDKDLIERYVCLGDDFEDEEEDAGNDTQGRFADITKSADLTFARPGLPLPLCIRDTPGVNDTFMMREQITIRAIRDSRICVVVLSAHQALSTMDMALIRLISNVKARDVVIFVNRIDELSDPARQVPEIKASIAKTLKAHDGPEGVQILFGSAYWAEMALSGELSLMENDSAQALLNWAEAELELMPDSTTPEAMIWELSGLPALYRALGDRIAGGVGGEILAKVTRSATNLINGVQAGLRVVEAAEAGGIELDRDELVREIGAIEARSRDGLEQALNGLVAAFHVRMDRSHKSFVDRALANLISHLENYGEQSVWQYSPAGLRLLLRSAYQIFGAKSQTASRELFETAANDYGELSAKLLGGQVSGYEVVAPEPRRVPPPVALGQTIALDLQGRWWKNWWQRRRGYQAFAAGYFELIRAETQPIVEDLKESHAEVVRLGALESLEEFMAEQRHILLGIADRSNLSSDEMASYLGRDDSLAQKQTIEGIVASLSRAAA